MKVAKVQRYNGAKAQRCNGAKKLQLALIKHIPGPYLKSKGRRRRKG
jgi:hypothetical protein